MIYGHYLNTFFSTGNNIFKLRALRFFHWNITAIVLFCTAYIPAMQLQQHVTAGDKSLQLTFQRESKKKKEWASMRCSWRNGREMRKNLKKSRSVEKKVLPPRKILITVIYNCIRTISLREYYVKLLQQLVQRKSQGYTPAFLIQLHELFKLSYSELDQRIQRYYNYR